MYYWYPCLKGDCIVWEYEDAQEAEWDAGDRLVVAMKEHYAKEHTITELLQTDVELKDMIMRQNGGIQSGREKPPNAAS